MTSAKGRRGTRIRELIICDYNIGIILDWNGKGTLRSLAGITMHRDSLGRVLPVLPRGDPDAPRAQPRFRVGGDFDQHGIQ